MSVLVKEEILTRLDSGELAFTPPIDSFQMHMHSVDLRIGFTFLISKMWELTDRGREALRLDHLDGGRKQFDVLELEEGQYFELLPNEFVLISTLEKVKMPADVMGILYPRSSVNRQGMSVDLSGIVDAGYEGTLVIPVRNNTPSQIVRIYPGERFCQLSFHLLSEKVKVEESRYHNRDITSGVLPERKKVEVALIKKGQIKQLKQKFAVKIKP